MKSVYSRSITVFLYYAFFSLRLSATSIKVSGNYTSDYIFQTDTVFVIAGCSFNKLTIDPGTRVIFEGNYSLWINYLECNGTVNDSIYFFPGNVTEGSTRGSINTNFYYSNNPLDVNYCVFRNLNYVSITDPLRCKLLNCNTIFMHEPVECGIINCMNLSIRSKILNSTVKKVNTIHCSFTSDKSFIVKNCLFENNNCTMFIATDNICIASNYFRNNSATPIDISGGIRDNVFIVNNCFYNNHSNSISGALAIANDFGAFVLNNTFYNNKGRLTRSLFFCSTTGTILKNNIFWNSDTTTDVEIKLCKSITPPVISADIIRGGSGSISIEDGNYSDEFDILNIYPEFIDSLHGDNLELSRNSPAINRGRMPLPEPLFVLIDEDLKGSPRSFGKSVDIGAYEYIPSAHPDIQFYLHDTSLFTGDTLFMNIRSNDFYDYSWFRNESLIPDEKDTCLIIPYVGIQNSGEYKVSVCNLTDTLWSLPARVRVYPDPLFPDTLFFCGDDPLIIRTGLTGCRYLWSTGDTTSVIQVSEPGNYQVQISAGTLTPRWFSVTVAYYPGTLNVAGSYSGTKCWCSDTVFITGNCDYTDSLLIDPGTTIVFTGDYTLRPNWLSARGLSQDSIRFIGNTIGGELKQGRIVAYISNENGTTENNEMEELVFRGLKDVRISGTMNSSFSHCSTICAYNPHACEFTSNDTLLVEEGMSYCTVEGTGYLSATVPDNSTHSSFDLSFSHFRNNSSPLWLNSVFDYLTVNNNVFERNKETAIRSNYPARVVQLSNNLFAFNTSAGGPGALSLVLFGQYSPILYNNTFYRNEGLNSQSIGIENMCRGNIELLNNIFWENSTGKTSRIVFTGNPFDTLFITNSILQHGLGTIESENPQYIDYEKVLSVYPEFTDTLSSSVQLGLMKNSPAINAGALQTKLHGASDHFDMFHDLNNQPRVFGKSVDIGAYEYIPVAEPAFSWQTPDTTVCAGHAVTLKAVSDDWFEYSWYKNSTVLPNERDDSLRIQAVSDADTGIYQVAITNLAATVMSEPIYLNLAAKPVITDYTPSVKVCENEYAEFSLTVQSVLEPDFTWLSTLNGLLDEHTNLLRIPAEQSDIFRAVASTYCGSDTSGYMLLTLFPLPEPDLGNDIALYQGDSVLLDAGEFDTYIWNTGSIERYVYGEGGDTLWVLVDNQYSCEGSDTIILYLHPVSIGEPESQAEIILYPNPVTDKLYVRVSGNISLPYRISIISQDGKIVHEVEIEDKDEQILNVAALEKGFYMITLRSASASAVGKFFLE